MDTPKLEQKHLDALDNVIRAFHMLGKQVSVKPLEELPALIREVVAENERQSQRVTEYEAALRHAEHFLTQVDPVHWPSKKEARDMIWTIRVALQGATPPQAPAVPRETQHALREGACIAAADQYFGTRAWLVDTASNRRIFEAGFNTAYDAAQHPAPTVAAEPVAVIGSDYALFWIGSGPIAPIIERHGLRVGDKLYSTPQQPAPDCPICRNPLTEDNSGAGSAMCVNCQSDAVAASNPRRWDWGPLGMHPSEVGAFIQYEQRHLWAEVPEGFVLVPRAATFEWIKSVEEMLVRTRGQSIGVVAIGQMIDDMLAAAPKPEAQAMCESEIARKYRELLYNVSVVHPGESRHETALRYIRNAERQENAPAATLYKSTPDHGGE